MIAVKEKKLSIRFKTVLGVFILIMLIIMGGLIHYSRKIEPMVAQRIRETIHTATDSLYEISFSDIHLNPFTGTVKLDDLQFRANDRVYQRMREKGVHPTHLYSIAISQLSLKRIHPFKVYFKNELDLNKLHISNPTIRVYYQNPREKGNEPEDKRTAWQRLSKYLTSIKIGHIEMDNIDFQYIDRSLGKPEIDGVKNLSIDIDDLLIDSLSQYDKSRFYFTREIFVRVRKHEYLSRDKLYLILLDDVQISSSKKYALIKGLQVVPRFSEMEFSKHLPSRKARYELNLQEALLKNIDIKRLIDQRQLRASHLTLNTADLKIFMDKSKPAPTYDRGINFPQLALKRLRLNSLIDSVKIFNSSVHYNEYTPVTARTGKIFLNKVSGQISNFTNDSVALSKNKWITAEFSSLLFGRANLDLSAKFDLKSPKEAYNYSGSLSQLNAKHFNQLSRALALLKINSGKISEARFSVNGDYRNTKGKLTMRYDNLNIGLLKIDSQKVIKKQMLMSMVANNLLIKEDNPMKGEKLRIGTIKYTRPDSITFFGTIWHSIYSGLRETIGLTPEREKNLKAQFQRSNLQNPYRTKRKELRRGKRIERLEKMQFK